MSNLEIEVVSVQKKWKERTCDRWEKWQDDFLRLVGFDYTASEIAKYLNRTKSAIINRRTLLIGSKNRKPSFEPWEHDFLILSYPYWNKKDIASYLKSTPGTIKNYCENILHINARADSFKVGMKFGRLTIESFSHIEDKKGKIWNCICECGNKRQYTSNLLKRFESCGCLRIEIISTGTKLVSGKYYSDIKRNAKSRNLEFSISIEYIENLLIQQNHRCKLSNLSIKIDTSRTDWVYGETTASLDRIDSDLPYIEGNVQWVHKDINYMKQNYSDEYFIFMCKKVAETN